MVTAIQLVDFEATHLGHPAAKESQIRNELGIAPARYYQLLHRAITTPEAIAHDPQTCAAVRGRLTKAARTRAGR